MDEETHERLTDVEHKLIEHGTSFSNGREVMAEMKAEIQALKPKAPDWMKLGGLAVATVSAILAGHYWIVEKLNDRPDSAQIEKIMGNHADRGHAATDKDIRDISEVQVEQRTILSNQATTLKEHGGKLDTILERLPRRKSREED
jgi:hypothetical protein